ncbi:DUF3127 domain-containing protein [Psychroserpens ponticola]|uniref:DUF3127 domain-containing protein n=1 Tax=Psychroserpens ponticola TaxID=2932268 RepID=A0ABY7RYD9_9FLAO|nr:DUF3127 domain-containing protein [Psychroserpens ponticola]WCO01730.1 DUF3127 domain-containing protein [Psychroserpens ponticola]
MELIGKIKVLNDIQNIGSNGFRKREVVITTEEQYPQHILVEFIQDKCDLLDSFVVGQEVKIALNLRGREWINPEGVAKYFNAIQGWRIELVNSQEPTFNPQTQQEPVSFLDEVDNDLPF